MIPIVSVIDMASFLISVAVAMRLYISYQRSKSLHIKYFFLCFVFVAILFLLLASPGIITSDPHILAFLSAISTFSAVLAVMFFTLIPILLVKLERIKYAYVSIVIVIGFVALLMELTNAQPFIRIEQGSFVYWLPASSPPLDMARALSGIVQFISLLTAGAFFLVYGFRNRTTQWVRSLILGASALLFAATGGVNYILGASPTPATFLTAAILGFIALIVLVFGIFYKRETSEWAKKPS